MPATAMRGASLTLRGRPTVLDPCLPVPRHRPAWARAVVARTIRREAWTPAGVGS